MPRGANDTRNELAIAELYGAIKQQLVFFAAETGVSASWVAERISELLSPSRERVLHSLSAVRHETTGVDRTVEQVEMVIHAHRGQTPPQLEAGRETRKTSYAKSYWDKMTPEERSAEMKRRQKKWTPEAKAKWAGTKESKAKKGRPTKAEIEHKAKRKMYQARYAARKRGETLPPLPKELAQAIQ